MKILEEFWYGNIDPAEYDSNASKEYKEALRLISCNEEKLQATMTDEQKDRNRSIISRPDKPHESCDTYP